MKAASAVVAERSVLCCACAATVSVEPIERHLDPFSGQDYRILRCPACGVEFSDPCDAVPAGWYEKAMSAEPVLPPEEDPRFSEFFARAPAPGRLLDVGCGVGGFLSLARARGWNAVGVDFDGRRVERAKAAGLEAYAEDWPTFLRSRLPGEFEVVTLFDVLEHVPKPAELLAEVARVLKPGGVVLITLPNAARPLPFGREDYDYPPHHFTRWTAAALSQFVARAGFEAARVDASRVDWRYLLTIASLHWGMKPAVALAKRLLFGRGQPAEATVTGLLERGARPGLGALADKGLRARLFGALHAAFRAAYALPLLALSAGIKLSRRDAGHCLYLWARKRQ